MPSSKSELLVKLDILIADFLKAYAVKKLEQLEFLEQIDSLKIITFGEKKQYNKLDYRFETLQTWFEKNAPRLRKVSFSKEIIETISKCADKIASSCAGNIEYDGQRSVLFDRKQAAGVSLMANAFLKDVCESSGYEYSPMGLKLYRSPESIKLNTDELLSEIEGPHDKALKPSVNNDELKKEFRDSLKYQMDYLDQYRDSDIHLFTILDNLFKLLEDNPDTKTNHLAGSLLYFMKINNYKIAPYIRRLTKLNRHNSEK